MMRLFIVKYWQEGPGRSDYHECEVLAKTKQIAINLVNRDLVYKCNWDETSAKEVKRKQAYIMRYL